ncbi:hypothetical protein MMC19_004966 [Ptychographa xylographoides]|nr:hypothetical protein [Ptychographa xylographoides]
MSSLSEAGHPENSRGSVIPRSRVTISECQPGYILFIRKHEDVLLQDHIESQIPREGLHHPALVISVQRSMRSHVLVCPLTTFGGRTIQEKFPHNYLSKVNYIPVYPQSATYPNGLQLFTDGDVLKKAGYLNTDALYTVHTNMLRAYDYKKPASSYRLTPKSFAQVARILELRLGPQAVPLIPPRLLKPVPLNPRQTELIPQAPQYLRTERTALLPPARLPQYPYEGRHRPIEPDEGSEQPNNKRTVIAVLGIFAALVCCVYLWRSL